LPAKANACGAPVSTFFTLTRRRNGTGLVADDCRQGGGRDLRIGVWNTHDGCYQQHQPCRNFHSNLDTRIGAARRLDAATAISRRYRLLLDSGARSLCAQGIIPLDTDQHIDRRTR
jgi:hypothetical protein